MCIDLSALTSLAAASGYTTRVGERIFGHITPGRNLRAILTNGLRPNIQGGNYAGYEESLDGVYMTSNPDILTSHVMARNAHCHYLVTLIAASPKATLHVDEDVFDSHLEHAAAEILSRHGLSLREAADGLFMPDHPAWSDLAQDLPERLGPVDADLLRQHPGHVAEYVQTWVLEQVYGEDTDPMWWADAKEILVRLYPQVRHPAWGDAFDSWRVPQAVTHQGDPRLLAVIDVIAGEPRVAPFPQAPLSERERGKGPRGRLMSLREFAGLGAP